MTYLDDKQVAAALGVARSTIWRWCRQHRFPQPRKFGPGVARWSEADVQEFADNAPRLPRTRAA